MGGSVHVWLAPAGDSHLSAHELLLALASTLVTGPVLSHDPAGRPQIPGLAVSISHTHHLLAVAASYDGPLGVDVEEVHPREVRALAERWFHPTELEWMGAQPDQLTAFLHLWTAKEAVGKALGTGLRNAGLRRRIPLPAVEGAAGVARPLGGEGGLAVLHLPVEQAVLAVALPSTAAEVVVTAHHATALRRAVRSRTSFPVVVRGN